MSWLTDNLPGIAAIVGGGAASVLGAPEFGVPIMAGGLGMMGQQSANQTNITMANNANSLSQAQAIQQEQYQTEMSNTAYQRQAADMKAAGINPIMAGVQGGASTPSGAMGQVTTPRVESVLGAGLSSAADVSKTLSALKQADTAASAQGSQAVLNTALGAKAYQEAATSGQSAKNMKIQEELLSSQLKSAKAQADYETKDYTFKSQHYLYDAIANRINRDTGTAKNLLNPFPSVPLRAPQSTSDNGDNYPWFNINGSPVPF